MKISQKLLCNIHHGKIHNDCPCFPSLKLHKFPDEKGTVKGQTDKKGEGKSVNFEGRSSNPSINLACELQVTPKRRNLE